MEIHLILLVVNKFNQTLQGRAHIYYDCMGALVTVANLPTNQIPCRYKHSDILKKIMVDCRNLTFACSYSHVKSHQDDDIEYQYLSRPSQPNYIVNLRSLRTALSCIRDISAQTSCNLCRE